MTTLPALTSLPDVPEVVELGERLLSPDEVAAFLGVTRETVLDLAQGRGRRRLACVHVNARQVRFQPEDVRAFVRLQRKEADAARLRDQLVVKRAQSPARRSGVRRPA